MFEHLESSVREDEVPSDLKDEALEALQHAYTTGKVVKGTNETTKAVERGEAELLYIAKDVSPEEIVQHLPELAHEKGVPYILIPTQDEIGFASGLQVGTAAAAIVDAGDADSAVADIKSKAESGSNLFTVGKNKDYSDAGDSDSNLDHSDSKVSDSGDQLSDLDEFFAQELADAGYAGIDVAEESTGLRITVEVENLDIVVDERDIGEITEELEERFSLDDPEVEVQEVEDPDLNPRIVADRLATALERGWYFRKAGPTTIDRVMEAGALGAEIVLSGKVTGARSRVEKYNAGCFENDIELSEDVIDEGESVAEMKLGTIGVAVRIVQPDAEIDDDFEDNIADDAEDVIDVFSEEGGYIGEALRATPHTLFQLPKEDPEAYFYYFTDEQYTDESSKFRTLDSCLTTLGRYRKGIEVVVIDRDRLPSPVWDLLIEGFDVEKYPALVVAEEELGVRDVGYDTRGFTPNETNYAILENGLITDHILQDSDELKTFLNELYDAAKHDSVKSTVQREKIISVLTIGKNEIESILSVQA